MTINSMTLRQILLHRRISPFRRICAQVGVPKAVSDSGSWNPICRLTGQIQGVTVYAQRGKSLSSTNRSQNADNGAVTVSIFRDLQDGRRLVYRPLPPS